MNREHEYICTEHSSTVDLFISILERPSSFLSCKMIIFTDDEMNAISEGQ
jgi:hypothetical protein